MLIVTMTLAIAGLGIAPAAKGEPARIIFDTDIGNDIDDALALAMLHTLADRGQVALLGVTVSKDNRWSAPFVNAINTFYGRPGVPIGVVRNGRTPEDGNYTRPVVTRTRHGKPVYPHDLVDAASAPEAVALQRRLLAAQPDGSVVFVVVGFSTNIARLLESPGDEHSPLGGRDLVAKKVRLLSIMAGMYAEPRRKEYNVFVDVESARRVYRDWPTAIVASGFEIGEAIRYPSQSIEEDFNYVGDHPVAEAYRHYMEMPYSRQCWDLTSVLYAVEPDEGYFGLSQAGVITIDEASITHLRPDANGRHRYLTVTAAQIEKTRRRLVELVSARPKRLVDGE